MDQPTRTVPATAAFSGTLYTTQEVANLLHVSSRTVQRWIKTQALTAIRFGTLIRIREADLATFGEVLNQRPLQAPEGEEQDAAP